MSLIQKYRLALRAAAGKRHSAADQTHLDAAAVHLHAAGANCPPMPADVGEPKAASAYPDDAAQLQQMADFRQSFHALSAASRIAAAVPATSRAHLLPPDPYEPALKALREREGR